MNPIFCSTEIPNFLKIFDLSDAPQLLFYTYIPAIIISIFLGIYVYRNSKTLESRLFSIITSLFTLWILDILIVWIAAYNNVLMFAWQITPIFEVPLFIFIIYFIYVVTDKERKDINPKLKLFFLAIMTSVFLIVPTHFNIPFYNISNCEGIPGIFWNFEYIFELISIAWVLGICLKRYRNLPKTDTFRKEIVYFGIGTVIFMILFVGPNIIGQITDIQTISFLDSLGMTLFLAFLVYLIVRFKEFNIKLLATQALVWALVILIGSEFFFVQNSINKILTAVTLVISAWLGLSIVRSVKKEIKQKEELAVTNEQLSEFMSFASHEIKGPMGFIKSISSMALSNDLGELNSKLREAIRRIYIRANDLIDLADQYLNKSKIELSQISYVFEDFDIGAELKQVVEDFQQNAEEQKIAVIYDNAGKEIFNVKADKGKMKEVFRNIIGNAIKFTPTGSVTASISKTNDSVLIKVKDTGNGIEKEKISILFKKFSRADTKATNAGGSGLGLYLSKIFVEAHHGKIWVESEGIGKGTTFFVELPAKQ
jgi:signal transduction histidine kinase